MRSCIIAALLSLDHTAFAYKVAVAGANGVLGRDLVYQCLGRKWNVCAYTRASQPLFKPSRRGFWNEDTFMRIPMKDTAIEHVEYGEKKMYDAMIFALGGQPFGIDTSDEAVAKLCDTIPDTCKKVCLVSAFGVGDSLKRAEPGIRTMESWYLRDVYASKRRQEMIVCSLPHDVSTLILRPRALSHGSIIDNPLAISRKTLATRILDWIAEGDDDL